MNIPRQAWQSLGQFLVVFLSGIAVYQGFQTNLDAYYQPLVQGLLAALGIWGFSKLPTGKKE